MARPNLGTKRISIRVAKSLVDDFDEWALRWGVPRGTLVSMAAAMGFQVMKRLVAPEETMSPETVARIIKAMNEMGLEVKLPGHGG